MKPDITDVITDLVRQAAPDLAARLEYQAEALREGKPCEKPALGRWIDENEVKYLISTFALEDKDFAARFPTMAHLTGHERKQFVAAIEAHLESCPHCSLKRAYDMELDARIKRTCRDNRDALLQLLKEAKEETEEEEAQIIKLEPADSAQ